MRRPVNNRRGNTEETLVVVQARVPNGQRQTAVQITLALTTTNMEGTPQCAEEDMGEASRRPQESSPHPRGCQDPIH